MELKAVSNFGAFGKGPGSHVEDLESEPWGRDLLKVFRGGEEGEDFFDGSRNPLLLAQSMELETHF